MVVKNIKIQLSNDKEKNKQNFTLFNHRNFIGNSARYKKTKKMLHEYLIYSNIDK
jgi:hypothetical protein